MPSELPLRPNLRVSSRLFAVASLLAALQAGAATLSVNTLTDVTLPNVGSLTVASYNTQATRSLRDAIIVCNNDTTGPHTIQLPAGSFTMTIANTVATPDEDACATGDLDILRSVTIQGAGLASTFVRGGTARDAGLDKIFSINPKGARAGIAVTLRDMALQFGTNQVPAGPNSGSAGGALDFDAGTNGAGSLVLQNLDIAGNTARNGDGGALALFGGGTVTATNCQFRLNAARGTAGFGAHGGAIFVGTSATPISLSFSSCVVTNNDASPASGVTAEGSGGALFSFASGSVAVSGSRIANNTASTRATQVEASPLTLAAVAAQNNWWGSNTVPASAWSGNVNVSTPLQLTLTSNTQQIATGGASAIVTASIGNAGGFNVPNGTAVLFSTNLGTLKNFGPTTLELGASSRLFSSGSTPGTATISAAVDSQTVTTQVVIGVPYASWRTSTFGASAGDDTIAGPTADPDGDGVANLLEFALGRNPLAATGSGIVVDTDSGFLRLSAARSASAIGVTYTVEVSSDAVTWSSGSPATTTLTSSATQLVVRDGTAYGSSTPRFIRLRVDLVP